YLKGTEICARIQGEDFSIGSREALPMRGDHNVANALAAMTVGLLCGCSGADMIRALHATPVFGHALEVVRNWRGITFVNDSKGTNVDATLKALQSYQEPVVLILGGKDKGGDFLQLAESLTHRAKGVVVMGEAAQKILQALQHIRP